MVHHPLGNKAVALLPSSGGKDSRPSKRTYHPLYSRILLQSSVSSSRPKSDTNHVQHLP
jgi:hypothetical protein